MIWSIAIDLSELGRIGLTIGAEYQSDLLAKFIIAPAIDLTSAHCVTFLVLQVGLGANW